LLTICCLCCHLPTACMIANAAPHQPPCVLYCCFYPRHSSGS
jgi:hypothetical protein